MYQKFQSKRSDLLSVRAILRLISPLATFSNKTVFSHGLSLSRRRSFKDTRPQPRKSRNRLGNKPGQAKGGLTIRREEVFVKDSDIKCVLVNVMDKKCHLEEEIKLL